MAQPDYKSVLSDFMADIASKQRTDDEIFAAYPEFNNDKTLLDAAYQYANTVKANKYDEKTLESKFPEFFSVEQPTQDALQSGVSGGSLLSEQAELARQDSIQGVTNDPSKPYVKQKEEQKQPNIWQTFYKGLGAGVINTANGLLGFLNRANSAQIANDPMTLQMMAKKGSSPEEIAQAADATRARLNNAETERYEAWKKKADQLSSEAKPDGGEKSFTDYIAEGKIGKALQLGLGTAAESLPYTASALNPVATAAMIMSMSEQNYRQSLIDNPDMSDGQRIASAAGNAAIEMAVEHIGNPFKVFKAGKLTSPNATKWIKQVLHESKDNIYKGILRVLGFGAKEAGKEGLEEVVTTSGQDLYNTLLDWKDTNGLGLRSQWERAKQNNPNITPGQFARDKADGLANDFLGGALSGMMISGPSTGVGIVQNAKYYSKNGGSEASRTQAQQQLAVLQQLSDEFGVPQEEVAQAIVDYQAEKPLTPNQQAIINRGEELLTAIQQSEQTVSESEQAQRKEIVSSEGITPTEFSDTQIYRQEIEQEVQNFYAERTHDDGNIYPVQMAGDAEKQGFIVGSVSPVLDEIGHIINSDVVTVKWNDGSVSQESAKDLGMLNTEAVTAADFISSEVERRMNAHTASRIENGDEVIMLQRPDGEVQGFFRSSDQSMLEDENGNGVSISELEQSGWQAIRPDGAGGNTLVPISEELGQSPEAAQQQDIQQSEPQQSQAGQPSAPVVPDINTMNAEELGGSTVEYMGDKASATAFLEAERDKAEAEVRRLSKIKVTRYRDIEDFKQQNDEIQSARSAATNLYNKLQNALVAVNAYKTIAEQQEEAERKAREAAMREQRRQLAEAETAGDIEAKWQNTKKTVGFTATKTLPNGQKVNGHYILTEAGDVVPSHDPRKNYADSEGYVMENGQNVNDNNYKDPDVQRIAMDMAQNYGGQAVEQMPILENRAGRVLSGNNRTISGIIAAENNTDQDYLAALAENAQQFGFTPEQLAEYEHPRLQFVVEDELPFTTATFAMFNQQEKKTKSSVNRAVANSKMVTEAVRDKMLEIMDQYDSLDSFFGSESAAADIVQSLITEGLMTQQKVAGLTENTGTGFKFGQSGREYVTDMLLGTLFDEQTIKMLAGEKTLKQAILRALPSIVANRRLKGYELTDSINSAIKLLYEARKANEGKSTADAFQLYLRQVDAFEGSVKDRYNGFDIILAGNMSAGVEQLREILGLYNNSAMNEANGQMGFFEPRTIDDIKQDVYEYYTKQQPELAAALDGAAEAGTQSQSPVPGGVADAQETRPEVKNPQENLQESEKSSTFAGGTNRWEGDFFDTLILSKEEKQALLNQIDDGVSPIKFVSFKDIRSVLEGLGISEKAIQVVENTLAKPGKKVNGFFLKGINFLNSDSIKTGVELVRAYTHERQHGFTKNDPALLQSVIDAVSSEEAAAAVEQLSGTDFYTQEYLVNSLNAEALADELIAHVMGKVYATGESVEEVCRRAGIENQEVINILNTIDNEQRSNASLSKSRRDSILGNSTDISSQQDGRDSQPQSEGGLEREGDGVAGESPRGAEGGGQVTGERGGDTGTGSFDNRTSGGQVTPFKDTPLGKVVADVKQKYPGDNVAIVFREGDNYEIYDEDAVKAAPVLGLELSDKDGIPFVSFPSGDMRSALTKLIGAGIKIGISSKPDHKPSKGDYQIGDRLVYDGKTATIKDFTFFGTAILDVEGRQVEVSRAQLDDILDYGDYMYHIGEVVNYQGKRAQIVGFASGEPEIEVEGESERRYVSFSDIQRIKKDSAETPTDNRETSEDRETSETRATETEIGGALVDRLGDMGVGVSTDMDANRAALKAAKADKSDAGAIHYYKTQSGQQYGFSYKGRIYLDPTKIDAELPIHEYGHLWAEAMRRISPESWSSVVDTIKADQASWDFVRELRPELTDENEIAEEVIATFSGKRGAERLRAEYKKMHGKDADYKSKWGNIFQNISKAIQDFWKAVGDFLNIKYQSAEQIYDQVLKDFVDNMNPYQKVRDFLRARDAEYIQAAESGDIQKATNIFYDALRENIGNGITPYMSVGTYLQFKRLAKGVKTRDAAIIREAAEKIAPLIPDNAVLVPTPSHTGRATDMLDLANAISEITGSEVADILRSAPRESQYQAKKETGTPMASQQLGIMMEGTVHEDKTAIVIDNVVDSGNTAEACIQALGKGVVVTLADSAEQYRHAASLRSAAPILRDKDGKIVPLTKRFNLNGSRYLGRRMYLRPNDPRFSVSGTQVIPVGEKTLVGLHNISAEKLRKAIKMGGLANPSTAVINIASQNHEDYGAISLIMPSRLVDSDTGRNAGTFTGDIWSPTYPHVEKQMSDKGDDAYYAAITKAFGNNEARRPILSRAKLDFDDYLDSGNVRAGLAYWYLLEKGIEPGDVYFNSGISDDIKERFRPLYDKGILDLTKEDYRTLLSLIAEQQGKTAEDMLQDAQESKARYQQTIDDPEAKQFYKKIAQQAIDEIDLYGVRYNVLSNGYHAMERAIRNDGKIDLDSTLIAAQDIVQTQYQADFDKWISDMDERFDISEVLFEDFDRDGNRKYKPHTLANISRMMNKEDLQNAGDHGGLGATRGILVKRLETLADIRAEKGRLRPGTEEDIETEEWNKMQDEWFNKVLNPLSDMQKISDNPFSNVGYAETRLQEALRTKDPIAHLNKEYGYKIDPNGEWAKNLKDLVQRIKSLPTKYFETKFRRPVYLNEFANAVVPNDLPQDLRDGLTASGMTLFEYDPAEQGSRRAATLKATADEGIRFSISGNGYIPSTNIEVVDLKHERVNFSFIKNRRFMYNPNTGTLLLGKDPGRIEYKSHAEEFGDAGIDESYDDFARGWIGYDRGKYKNGIIHFAPPIGRANFEQGYETLSKFASEAGVNENTIIRGFGENWEQPLGLIFPNRFNNDIRFAISNQNNDIFYSNAERAVEGIKQDKATPEQWRAMIEKAGGLKAGEDKWIGLNDWLAQQRPTVTPQANETRSQFVERASAENKRFTLSKQDLLDYIREHKIQIEETEYNENGRTLLNWTEVEDYDYDTETGATYYTLDNENVNNPYNISIYHPDGRGYIVMDNGVENGEYDTFAEAQDFARMYFDSSDAEGNGINSTRLTYTTQGLENKREIALTVPTIESWNESDEIHFGDAGPGKAIAWVRFGDATDEQGNKTLVIDEIQSKRHQEGREKGYREISDAEKERLFSEVEKADSEWGDFSNKLREKYGPDMLDISEEDSQKIHDLYTRKEEAKEAYSEYTQTRRRQIPSAPFEKNWHELAMKRILRFAAENGYDKVAWTTGDQQARRYDLGKQLDELYVYYNDETGLYDVSILPKGGDVDSDVETLDRGLDEEGLKRTIGKDLYNRVMEEGKQSGWDLPVTLAGDDLVIGTDGMRGFYDDILPRFMQKYGKKWGVQVVEVTMPQLEEGYQTMHAIDINDAMRESVLEGQPMFSISGPRRDLGTMAVQPGETRKEYAERISAAIQSMTPRNTTIDDAIRFSITVNHNSPYLLKRADGAFVDPETGERLGFDHRFMGKGEGAQGHGWGSYFSIRDLRDYADPRDGKYLYKGKAWNELWNEHENPEMDAASYVVQEMEYGKTAEEALASAIEDTEESVTFHRKSDIETGTDYAKGFERRLEALMKLDVNDFSEADRGRHHYDVEIPDNNGSNYLEEGKAPKRALRKMLKAMTDEQKERIASIPVATYTTGEEIFPKSDLESRILWLINQTGWRDLYEVAEIATGSKQAASELLHKAGFVGIHYDGRSDGECYVIFDENDAVITDHIRFSVSAANERRLLNDEEKAEAREKLTTTKPIDAEIGVIKADNETSARKAAEQWAEENIPEPLHYQTDAGDVVIDKTSVKNSLAHGYNQAKLDAIPTLPEGFKGATYLGSLDEIDGSDRNKTVNHYFAYPINYNSELCYVFCRAKADSNKNRLYVHEVFVADKIKSNTLQTAAGNNSEPHRGIALYREILSDVLFGNNVPGKTMDTDETLSGERNNTATPQNTVFDRKGTTNNSDMQISGQENAENLQNSSELIGKVAKEAWNKYQYDGELESIRDLAEYIDDNMPQNETTQTLFDAIDKWRVEEKEDRMLYGERGDLEPFEDAILNEIERLSNNTNNSVISEYAGQPRFAISGDTRFVDIRGNTKSKSEAVTEALIGHANESFRLMQSALKKVNADLLTINAIRTQQFEHDRKVVDMLLNLYNSLLQENSVWAGYMPDTTRRIATQIVHAIGKKDISAEVNTIMDHMVHAQAKAAQRQWDKLRTTPVDKINISGVVMQGKVALQGQHALKAMNEALDSKATIDQLEDQIAQLMEMEDNATDESLKLQYKGQWIGYTIAAQHLERIQHLEEERRSLELELQDARSKKALKQSARQQLVANIKQAMRDNFIAQAEAYAQSAKDLAEYVTTQEAQAKDFIHRQDANRDMIRSYAQRDLEGLPTNPNRNRTRGNIARQIWDAFSSPIRDLQSLLRLTGLHAPDGEGYLYNHFMRGWIDGADQERTGIVAASKTLDDKIAELTHGKYKTWEEAARKINEASHNMFTITMLNGVDGKDMPVTEDIPLSAGNALYIYAVNKMNDGRMKLAGMNITEDDVKALTDKVREQFGQEILDVVDWVQREFFSQLRNRYNPTHEALFGAPMDAIENYFPLRINASARQQNEDLSEPDTDAARLLAGTSTGAIKRRTKNSLPLDVRNADFFQEVIRHIAQMERWNAFAQWNRDANILFSDINFRNRIKGMQGTIYGSGDQLYNYMKDAFRVAIGTYKPKTDTFSEITLNVAKGVTSAKINFRVWTAIKQIASFPAFFTYMTDGVFVGSYLRNWMTPHGTMKWARENLPNFEKRVSKRDMGDMRLMQRTTDWQWNKRVLEWSQKYGMAANVYFDTLTCATGARAVYDSRLAEYLKKGYPQEQAEQRARQDAEQAFNTSQQSSEGAFMSAVQMDRNLVTAALTVFRTSPIQYTRNFFYHTRNLLRKFGKGSKEEQIAFRTGQYKNDGLNDEQARKAAEKDYNKSIRSDIAGFVVYGALLNILWRLVGQVPYLFFGDDDDKKKQILEDATSGGAWFSPFTGLLGGGIVESALDGNGSVADMFAPELPFTQDVKRVGKYLENDKYAEFANQALSVAMQSGTGFDPQTAADMIQRIVTTIDSDEELDAATKAIQISFAVASVPQSQYEQMFIDRVVANEGEYDAALEDYIRYQKVHTAPLTWWMRGEESAEKAEENAVKRFNRLLNERDALHNPVDYEE